MNVNHIAILIHKENKIFTKSNKYICITTLILAYLVNMV